MPGRFYGVGVGPGDPELLTLKALRVLKEVEVIAYPYPSRNGRSYAFDTVLPHIDPAEKEVLPLHIPMSRDPEIVEPAWEKALGEIVARLDAGLDIAFVTEGDPFLYSTFIHLFRRLEERRKDVPVTVIPGVTSITAAAIRANVPLADRDDSVAIIPATYGTDAVREALDRFDTVVLMKVSSRLPEVLAILEERGLTGNAFLVEKATSREERVVTDLKEAEGRTFNYLSTLIVTKGRVPQPRPPLLILVHGSPVRAATMEMGDVAEAVRGELPGVKVVSCHLEHTSPDLGEAIRSLKDLGHAHAVVVPYFLFRAKHLKREVPDILREAADGMAVTVTAPLWPHDTVMRILEERARGALSGAPLNGPPTLLLVGRGSSDPSIPGILSGMARELEGRLGLKSMVGYSDVTEPRIEEAVHSILEGGGRAIVALPLYLSHGALAGEIPHRIGSAMNGQSVPFRVAEPLGPDRRLSRIIAQRYREATAS